MYVLHVCFVPMEAGRRLQILWHWCYEWLWNMKVLKNKPGSSQRTSALTCQVIFPALVSYLVRTIFVLLILIYYVCFACMYVYASHACLKPAKLDKGIGSPGIGAFPLEDAFFCLLVYCTRHLLTSAVPSAGCFLSLTLLWSRQCSTEETVLGNWTECTKLWYLSSDLFSV